jgi:hypothetical protein
MPWTTIATKFFKEIYNMSKIICKIEMFDLNQKIFLSNNGELTPITDTTIEDLPAVLTDISWQTEIPKIVLYGNKFYA